jgi:NADPH:quinone reductase-like Zn-dependent oxidoreductase
LPIQALAISELRKDGTRLKSADSQNLLSSTVVGVAKRCDLAAIDLGIIPGQRVASILPYSHGKNPTNVLILPQHLIAVPNNFDAADIACILAFYLPAFQVLHHGQRTQLRYSRLRFKDKKLLIKGGASQLVKSIIRMAKYSGATEIFVIAPLEEHTLLSRLEDVITLDEDHEDWLPQVDGEMDLIIDCSFPHDFQYIRLAMAPKARLVCYPSWGKDSSALKSMSEMDYLYEFCQLSTMKRASIFDLEQSAEINRAEIKEDMDFLIELLDIRQIRPVVERFTNSKDIIETQLGLRGNRLHVGALIYEPVKTQNCLRKLTTI